MKRLLLVIPLVFVVAGCAASDTSSRVPAPRPPILSRASRIDGTPLRLDIADLRRRGRSVVLDMRLRSNASRGHDEYLIGSAFSATANGDFSAMSLIDPATGARLRPAAWDPDTDPDLYDELLTPGGTKTLSVSFPAPRGRTADVLVPHFGSFRDVPVK